ncbi:MAG: hypothetical protein AAFX87_21900 [Bacteroidota bacterium]
MKKKVSGYEGSIHHLPKKIMLNVDYLQKGEYQLQIIHDRKVIKTLRFTK